MKRFAMKTCFTCRVSLLPRSSARTRKRSECKKSRFRPTAKSGWSIVSGPLRLSHHLTREGLVDNLMKVPDTNGLARGNIPFATGDKKPIQLMCPRELCPDRISHQV